MNFAFLNDLSKAVVAAPVKAVKEKVEKEAKAKASKLPEGLRLRVYANGKVYPSAELVSTMHLEFVAKDSETIANGLDIFPSNKLAGLENFNCILVSATSKKSPKVDLFGQCGYDETGAPKASALTQGGGSFGPELVELIKTVYGITIEEGTFLDMEVRVDVSPTFESPIVFIPKTVARGEKKGSPDYARRENITINPLVPVIAATEVAPEIEELPAVSDAEATQLLIDQEVNTILEIEEEVAPIPTPNVVVNGIEIPEKPAFVMPNLGNADPVPTVGLEAPNFSM